MLNVVFLGTGDIGLPALRWLIEDESCEVVGVFTQPDRPYGRKLVMTPPEVKVVAQKADIPVFQPERLRDSSALN
ncbi:MAG: methionyl-tRNA formyltransferase, partial [Verrucomicrobiota bacterium]